MTQPLMEMSQIGAKRTGSHKGGIRQKYILSDADRNLIRAVYSNPEYGSVGESIDYLVDHFHAPRTTIKGWAKKMGLTRTKEDRWTPEELAYLEENYQRPAGKRASLKSIAAHLGRTEAAVHIKAVRMKFRRTQSDTYTIRALADALGCDFHKVERWINNGWLDAPLDKSRENGQHAIKPAEIRRFIIDHPSEIDHRRGPTPQAHPFARLALPHVTACSPAPGSALATSRMCCGMARQQNARNYPNALNQWKRSNP